MNTPTIKVELTVHQVVAICDALKELRSNNDSAVRLREDWASAKYANNPDTGKYEPTGETTIYSWTIKGAEEALAKRAQLANLVAYLSGEVLVEDPEVIVSVHQGRAAFDAQEAQEAAKADQDA
jgi:hypothetical protein